MTTIAQLSAYLATLPQDATVEVLEERDGSWTMYTTWAELDVVDYSKNMVFTDYTNTLYLGRN